MNDPLACIARTCRRLGQHRDVCEQPEECPGCLPRLAADGLMLCPVHVQGLAGDARAAGRLWVDLGHVLAGGGGHGERSSAASAGLSLSPAAMDARGDIRSILVAWARLVAEERGFSPPRDAITEIAGYVARNAPWIAAYRFADDAVDELRELRRHRAIAYPSGARRFTIRTPDGRPATCPHGDCAGHLVARIAPRDDLPLPGAVVCSAEPEHTWRSHEWHRLGRALTADWLTAGEIAAAVGAELGTVYRWAAEDRWRRTSTKPRGYLAVDVLAGLAARGLGVGVAA